jgi:hypothetical protein
MSTRILLQPHIFKNSVDIEDSLNLTGSLNLNGESLSSSLSAKSSLNKFITTVSEVSSYELVSSDNGKIVKYEETEDITVFIPENLFSVGCQITFVQHGVGKIIISPATGVVCNNLNNGTKSSGMYATMTLTQIDLNVWVLSGDVTV